MESDFGFRQELTDEQKVHYFELAAYWEIKAEDAERKLLGMYYVMQAFKKEDMAKGIYIAFGYSIICGLCYWTLEIV